MSFQISVEAGMVFCVVDPRAGLGKAINIIQKIWDIDSRSKYTHSGIILDSLGTTFEALWHVERHNLFEHYRNSEILIGRNLKMTDEKFKLGFDGIKHFEGRHYPFFRLPLHIIPPLAKYFSTGYYLVCSELTGKFFVDAGLLNFYKGLTPNYISDMIQLWDDFEIVFEGRCCDITCAYTPDEQDRILE